jgi:hypothetical protein
VEVGESCVEVDMRRFGPFPERLRERFVKLITSYSLSALFRSYSGVTPDRRAISAYNHPSHCHSVEHDFAASPYRNWPYPSRAAHQQPLRVLVLEKRRWPVASIHNLLALVSVLAARIRTSSAIWAWVVYALGAV